MQSTSRMRTTRSQDGSTLVEVAVAMATVAILAFSVMLGFSTSTSQDRQALEVTRLQDAAVALLETFESRDHDELLLLDGWSLPIVPENSSILATITFTEVSDDLVALEVVAVDETTGLNPVRLVTLKTRKEEVSLQ